MSVMNKIRVASFFSGAGGLALVLKAKVLILFMRPGNIAIPLLNVLINRGGGRESLMLEI